MRDLDTLRKEIDKLDEEILKAIGERLSIAREIGEAKKESGKPVLDSKREEEVYEKIDRMAVELNIEKGTARRIFYEIIQLGKAKQVSEKENQKSDLEGKIAFQGEHGAYSEAAVKKGFPKAQAVPYQTFNAVFEALEKKEVSSALLPVENSTEGSVTPVYDLLAESNVKAFQEVFLRIEHCLIGNKNANLKEIKEVYSHPQALAQCSGFIKKLGLKPVPYYDTAGAVLMVKESGRKDIAAIASGLAADHYDMQILEKNIEDNSRNTTRFLALRKEGDAKMVEGSNYKTSLVFAVRHEPGSLFRILKTIAEKEVNLTKLESRPSKHTRWEYVFFVDFEGHREEPEIADMLKRLEEDTLFIKIFGSYMRGN